MTSQALELCRIVSALRTVSQRPLLPICGMMMASPAAGLAQMPLQQHEVAGGIILGAPATWQADSPEQLAAIRGQSIDWLSASSLEFLRETAAENSNVLLFRAAEPAKPQNAVNLNATVDSTISAQDFAALDATTIRQVADVICQQFIAQTEAMGGGAWCLAHEVRTIQGSEVLIVHQRYELPAASILSQRMVALIPRTGVLLTLSFSMPEAEFDSGLANAVLESLRTNDD